MRLFSEEVVPTFTSSDHNIITVEDYNEIFFDVYEFEINGKKVIAEKVSEYKGYPVVDVPVVLEGNKFCAPFILERGEFSVYYNPDNATFVSVAEETEERTILEDDEQKDEVEEILFERRDDLLAEIQEARKSAAQFAEIVKQQKLEQADNEIVRKREELKSELDETRTNIVQEFYSIIEGVKSEIHNFTDQECGKINAYVEARIDKLSKKLVEDIDNKSTTAKDEFINDLNELAANILTTALVKEADQTHKHYSAVFDEKFNTVSTSVTRLVQEKIEALKASTDVEFKAIEKVNLDAILGVKKGLDKALSRIGTVKSQLNESLQEKSTELQERIAEAQKRIESYYDTKLLDLDNKLDGVSAETKLETIKLIEESKASLLETINNIKVDVPNIIIERKNGATQEIDLKKVKKELEQTITTKFTNEVMSLKRMVEMMSGGGSVAQQFANGGTMNGNLTVTGAISASQYLGLPSSGGTTGAYLPLSGGTLTGNLSVVGNITSVDSIQLNTTSTVAVTSGQLTWNPTDGTVDIGMGFDGVVQQVGLEQYIKVTADGAIRDGSVVWYTGTTGNSTTLKGQMQMADPTQDPKHLLGVATQDIANGAQGFITTFGIVRSADITGLKPAGETWVEGDRLYASPTINGGWTNVEPSAPNLKMPLAFLLFINNNNNPTNVSMFVRRGNTFRLENLHNVYDTTYTHPDGSLLAYNEALSCWKPSLSASTSVDRLSANYIYTTQLDALSANITVVDIKQYELSGFNVTGSCTIQGNVSATGGLNIDTDTLVVDSVNNRVGIGTASTVGAKLTIKNDNDSSNWLLATINDNGNTNSLFTQTGTGDFVWYGYRNGSSLGSPDMSLHTNGNSFFKGGNVGIGTSTPNERLTVVGNISATGNLTLSSINASGIIGTPQIAANASGTGGSVTLAQQALSLRTGTGYIVTLNNSGLIPNINSLTLGSSLVPWSSAYCSTLSASGPVIGNNLVFLTGAQTIAGAKTFADNIVGNGTVNSLPNQTYTSLDSVLTPRVNAGLRGYVINRKCDVGGSWSTSHASGGGSSPTPSHLQMYNNTTLGSKSYTNQPQASLCPLGTATVNGFSVFKWDMSEMWFDWVFNLVYATNSSGVRTNQLIKFFAGNVNTEGMIQTYGGLGVRLSNDSSATNYDVRIFHAFGLPTNRAAITAATNASPIVITQNNHSFNTNDQIEIDGCVGNTAANGIWTITRIDANTYSLNGSTGNGTWTSGGHSHYISNVLLNTDAFNAKLARIHIHKIGGVFNIWLNDTILLGSVTYVASGQTGSTNLGFGVIGQMAKTLVASTGSTNMYLYELNYGGKD